MGKKKVPRWLLGCGLVFVLAVLSVVALTTIGVLGLRDAIGEFEVADATMEEVERLHGPMAAFRAEPHGAIPPERLEAFLAARDAFAESRARTDDSLALLSDERDVHFAGFRQISAGARLLHQLAGFVQVRNQALLDADMGFGEYYYTYTVAYLVWLGYPPDDGPAFELVGDNGYVLQTAYAEDSEPEVRDRREALTRHTLNTRLLPVLRAQLAAAESDPSVQPGWPTALATEIARLEADPRRIPWEDGLPPAIADSLAPYRERLEASYSTMCSALELGLARR
jgi:hypothetical protein